MAYSAIGASADIPSTTTTTNGPTTTTTATQIPGKAANNVQLPPKPYMHFHVKMTCSGCSGAIERVLKKNIGPPNEFSVSLPDQTVLIWGPSLPDLKDVRAKIEKTGKEILSQEYVKEAENK